MGDPELVARAQRAAERLERSWDRWRRLHGLAAEQAQPVSSYVGYSLAEPWGRPRVVFGVGAEEAERLSALLEQDVGDDPRFSQGLLWEPGSAETGEFSANGSQPPASPANAAQSSASSTSTGQYPASSANGGRLPASSANGGQYPASSVNGGQPSASPANDGQPQASSASGAQPQVSRAQPQVSGAQPQVSPPDVARFAAAPVPAGPVNGQVMPNEAEPQAKPAQFPAGPANDGQYPTDSGDGARFPGVPGGGQGLVNGTQIPGHPGQLPGPPVPEARHGEPEPETDPAAEWAKNMPTFQPAPTIDAVAPGDRSVPPGIRADLAGWTSGELPGQASAGLAAWPSADTPQADGAERAPARPEPDTREAAPRMPEDGPGSPDPAAWLRLALSGPEPLGAVGQRMPSGEPTAPSHG